MIVHLFYVWKKSLPKRGRRLLRHLTHPWKDPYFLYMIKTRKWGLLIFHFVMEIPLLIMDVFALPEFFELGQHLFKREARMLADHEAKLARELFRDQLEWSRIRIDQQSKVGTHGGKYAFVTYYFINSMGPMRLNIIIHELVHILQFEQHGSVYAIRNAISHLYPGTYNYGGVLNLYKILEQPALLHTLNYEQQADVFSDYVLLLMGHRPEWGQGDQKDLAVYYKIIQLILSGKNLYIADLDSGCQAS